MLSALILTLPVGARETVTAHVGAWPPYIDFTASGQGWLTQTVKAAFAKADIDLQTIETSWRTAEANLDAAKSVSFGWIKNADRLTRWRYSVPICTSRTTLLHRAQEAPLSSIEQIKGRTVGWSRGYRYGDTLDRLRGTFKESEMPTDEVGLRHLLAGKIDFMPMDEAVARQLLVQKFPAADAQQIVVDNSPVHTVNVAELYLVCNKRAAPCNKLIEAFNRGIRALRSNINLGHAADHPAGHTPPCNP